MGYATAAWATYSKNFRSENANNGDAPWFPYKLPLIVIDAP